MSFRRLRYHLIFVTKGRRPAITEDVEAFVYDKLCEEARALKSKISTIGGVEDHVHMLASIHPTVAVSDFSRDVKKQVTKAIRQEFPHLADFKWAIGYTAITVDPNDQGPLISYIANQKEHHARDNLISHLEPPEEKK